MKLIRLEFSGIGSFADRMEIDFGSLSSAGLFLIEGPTGSGKSTILDAIVFALYGSVAGAASDVGRLDSHLRDSSPFVELDFEVSGITYRVRRSPAHERRKRRGDGTTSQNATASLMRLEPEQTDLGNRASEVGENIGKIIGLNKQQFVSTVVLAQGEFAAFLDAGTSERSAILEKVFGTQFYTQVEDQLQAMRAEAKQRRAEAAATFEEAVHKCAGVFDVAIDPEHALPEIDAAISALRVDAEAAAAAAQNAEQLLNEQLAELSAVEALVQRKDRKRSAQQRRQALIAQQEQVESWRASLANHQRALPVVPAVEAWERTEADLLAARERVAQSRAALADLGESTDPAPDLRDRLVAQASALSRPRELESSLPAMRRAVEAARERFETAVQRSVAQKQRHDQIHDEVLELRSALLDGDEVQQRASRLESEVATLEQVVQLSEDLARKRSELAEAVAAADAAAVILAESQRRLIDAQAAQRQDIAAELAEHLEAGQPCLVCGSSEHPNPAVGNDAPALELAELNADVDAKAAEAQRLQGHVDKLAGAVEILAERVPDGHEQAVDELDQTRASYADAAELAGQVAERKLRLADLTTELQEVTVMVGQSRVEEQQASADLRTDTEKLNAAEDEVDAATAGFPSVAERLSRLETLREVVSGHLAARDASQAAERSAEESRKLLAETVEAAGFSDVAQARVCVLHDTELQRREEVVRTWDRQFNEVEAVLGELADVDLDQEFDVDVIKVRVAEAQQKVRDARAEGGKLNDRLQRAVPQRELVRKRHQHLRDVTESTDAVIRMADFATAARGEVIHKVRLSSFVLMRRFEDVVSAANDRLDTISEGRYQLRLETHGLDKRGQAGLDLRIYDGRSDSLRSTSSLSGGERFYVALALALGLADVVRSESGGVQLGTLFIDEGFGSLDPDVLEEVMDMLEQVRVGDDRVIGLISHVETLKQRIDPRISVRPDPKRRGVSALTVRV